MQKFIILCAPRTGSNHLCSLLNSHPDALVFGEIFSRDWSGSKVFDKEYSHRPFKSKLLKERYINPFDFFKEIFYQPLVERECIGFKIFYEHDHGLEVPKGNVWRTLKEFENLKVIHLRRENLLARRISQEFAERNKCWMIEKNKLGLRKRISRILEQFRRYKTLSFTGEQLLDDFENHHANFNEFQTYFKAQQIFNITYEELIKSPEESKMNILDFLELKQYELKSKCVKQSFLSPKYVLANYTDLKKYFTQTAWEKYFDE